LPQEQQVRQELQRQQHQQQRQAQAEEEAQAQAERQAERQAQAVPPSVVAGLTRASSAIDHRLKQLRRQAEQRVRGLSVSAATAERFRWTIQWIAIGNSESDKGGWAGTSECDWVETPGAGGTTQQRNAEVRDDAYDM
jgi:hypothetical protein